MKFSYKNQLYLFMACNIVASLVYVSVAIVNNIDIGQEEINFWYKIYLDKELSVFGGNYYWIFILDFFDLLPILTPFDVVGVFIISKSIQFGLISIGCRYFKPSTAWLGLLFLPNCFLYSNSMGRSSLDWSIAFVLAVSSLGNKYLHIGLACLSLFHKFLLFAIALVTFISEKISAFSRLYVVILFFILLYVFNLYSSDLIELTNYNYSIAEYGNYAIEGNKDQIIDIREYFLRSFAIVLPPFFLYQDIVALIFSIDGIALLLTIIKNRKFLKFSEYFIFLVISLSAVPFVYNYLSAARYFSVVLLYVSLRVLMRRSTYALANKNAF